MIRGQVLHFLTFHFAYYLFAHKPQSLEGYMIDQKDH